MSQPTRHMRTRRTSASPPSKAVNGTPEIIDLLSVSSLSPLIFMQASMTAFRQRNKTGQLKAFESYLALVSSMYYGGTFACKMLEGTGKRRRKGKGLTIVPVLTSPLRKDFGFETWSPYEIAVFETALCAFGKQFKKIEGLLGGKSYSEITQFYYEWKRTSHYQVWKTAFPVSI